MVERAIDSAWRFRWIFNPMIVAIVSVPVAALDTGRWRPVLAAFAVVPFVLLYLAASSFSLRSLAFAGGYIFISVVICLLVSRVRAV